LPIFDAHSVLGGSIVPGAAANAATISSTMQQRGIDSALVFSAHAHNVDPVAGNRILKANLEQSQNLYGCLVTHINRVEPSVSVMRELMGNRKMLGMAIASVHPRTPLPKLVADEIINAYRRYSKPLFLFAYNAQMVESALEIARSFTMLKVVLVGMGGHDWRTAIAAAHATTNIVLETSGPLDRAKLPTAVESIGFHRILFGSGTPRVDAAAALGLVEDSELAENAKKHILYDNAQKLFGLNAEE
jgi:hypothetical protein